VAMSDPWRNPPRNPIAGLIFTVARALAVAFGLFLVVIAIPIIPLPIPLGLPLLILGLVILAAASKTAHGVITGGLKRWPWLWSRIKRAFGE